MLRIGSRGRATGATAAVRRDGGSLLRRLLLVVGLLAGAWLLGSASASADDSRGPVTGNDAVTHAKNSAASASKAAPAKPAGTTDRPDSGSSAPDTSAPEPATAERQTQPQQRAARPSGDRAESGAPRQKPANPSVSSTVREVGDRAAKTVTNPASSANPAKPARAGAEKGNGNGVNDVPKAVRKVDQQGWQTVDAAGGPKGALKLGEHVAGQLDDDGDTHRDGAEKDTASAEDERSSADSGSTHPKALRAAAHVAVQGGPDTDTAPVDTAPEVTPERDDSGGTDPTRLATLGSAPSAPVSAPMVMFAGYLPTAADATPAPGLLQSARNALAIVPQNPVDEPVFSPD